MQPQQCRITYVKVYCTEGYPWNFLPRKHFIAKYCASEICMGNVIYNVDFITLNK